MENSKNIEEREFIAWGMPIFSGNEKEYLVNALESTWISGGKYVDKFENDFQTVLKSKHAVSVSNGTTALHLALLALDIKPGDEVIVPGFTFVAPANTVVHCGARPVLCDVEYDTFCIDPSEIEKKITDKTKAIIVVHIYGNICDMDTILKIAKKHNLAVVEDTAEACFSKYNGLYAGTIGDFGCFSFQATKTITMGEGGAVLTNSDSMNEKMRILRSHGMAPGRRYWHDVVGYNYRLTNLQAAIGCAQFEKRDEICGKKNEVHDRYLENLSDVSGIRFQKMTEGVVPVIWATAIVIDEEYFKGDRDWIIKELYDMKIETRPGFYPLSILPLYSSDALENSEKIGASTIVLPSHNMLTNDDIDYICDSLKSLMK